MSVVGSSTLGVEAGPLGAPLPPRVLERAASRVADSTASWHMQERVSELNLGVLIGWKKTLGWQEFYTQTHARQPPHIDAANRCHGSPSTMPPSQWLLMPRQPASTRCVSLEPTASSTQDGSHLCGARVMSFAAQARIPAATHGFARPPQQHGLRLGCVRCLGGHIRQEFVAPDC